MSSLCVSDFDFIDGPKVESKKGPMIPSMGFLLNTSLNLFLNFNGLYFVREIIVAGSSNAPTFGGFVLIFYFFIYNYYRI